MVPWFVPQHVKGTVEPSQCLFSYEHELGLLISWYGPHVTCKGRVWSVFVIYEHGLDPNSLVWSTTSKGTACGCGCAGF